MKERILSEAEGDIIGIFSRKAMTCCKCGGVEIVTTYRKGSDVAYGPCGEDCPDGEHLHRTCKTCGYMWHEPCQDAKEKRK